MANEGIGVVVGLSAIRALQLALGKQKPDAIRKSGEHAAAFAVLKRWQDSPKEGLF